MRWTRTYPLHADSRLTSCRFIWSEASPWTRGTNSNSASTIRCECIKSRRYTWALKKCNLFRSLFVFCGSTTSFHPGVTSRLKKTAPSICPPLSGKEGNNPKAVSNFLPFVRRLFSFPFPPFQLTSMPNPASAVELPPSVSAKTNEWMFFQKKDLFVLHAQNGCYLSHKGLFIPCNPRSGSIRAAWNPSARTWTLFCQSRAEPSRIERTRSESHSSERLAESR